MIKPSHDQNLDYIAMRVLIALSPLLFVSCVMMQDSIRYQRYDTVVLNKHAPVYVFSNSKLVGQPKIAPFRLGDTVQSIGYASRNGVKYNLFIVNSDTIAALQSDVPSLRSVRVRLQEPQFSAPKALDAEMWSRAAFWINRFSDMKIQIQSDLVIQTFTPPNNYGFGYTVSKVYFADSVRYTVKCLCGIESLQPVAMHNEKELAYYMQTGEEPHQ